MFILNNDNLNFTDNHLPDFVHSVSYHLYGKKVILKDAVATGDYKLLEFSNGFYAYVSNYIMNDDFALELAVAKDDYLALHINQIQAGPEFNISLNGEIVSYDDKVVTSLILTGGKDRLTLSGSKGACVNRLKILIPKSWVLKTMPVFSGELLNSYLALKEERLFSDSLDNTYRSLVDKVMNTEDNPFYLSVTQNIVTLIAERFFNRLHIKLRKTPNGNELSGVLA